MLNDQLCIGIVHFFSRYEAGASAAYTSFVITSHVFILKLKLWYKRILSIFDTPYRISGGTVAVAVH